MKIFKLLEVCPEKKLLSPCFNNLCLDCLHIVISVAQKLFLAFSYSILLTSGLQRSIKSGLGLPIKIYGSKKIKILYFNRLA